MSSQVTTATFKWDAPPWKSAHSATADRIGRWAQALERRRSPSGGLRRRGRSPGEASSWREWPPPESAEQPIFCPVVSEEDDATIIARDWNVKHSGQWLHDRFEARCDFRDR